MGTSMIVHANTDYYKLQQQAKTMGKTHEQGKDLPSDNSHCAGGVVRVKDQRDCTQIENPLHDCS